MNRRPHNADPRRRHRSASRGVTLVEMLIVITIVVILTATALPAFIRMGAFGRDALTASTRTVHGMLSTARVYAATYRVDTAVYYVLSKRIDSRYPDRYTVVSDTIGMARRMSDEELEALRDVNGSDLLDDLFDGDIADFASRAFLAVPGNLGILRDLEPGTSIWADVPELIDPVSGQPIDWQLLEANEDDRRQSGQGVTPIYVGEIERDEFSSEPTGFDLFVGLKTDPDPQTGERRPLFEDDPPYLGAHSLDEVFLAHVFSPSGAMRIPNAAEEPVFEVLVGPSPDVPVQDRFLDIAGSVYVLENGEFTNFTTNPEEDSVEADDPDESDVTVPYNTIELNQYTGKAEVLE